MAFKIKHNTRNVGGIMRGPEINALLKAKAEAVAAVAGAELQDPAGMLVVEAGDSKRARYIVVTATPEAMNAEALDRRLTTAIDAARG